VLYIRCGLEHTSHVPGAVCLKCEISSVCLRCFSFELVASDTVSAVHLSRVSASLNPYSVSSTSLSSDIVLMHGRELCVTLHALQF
jgi:hypothetical protein